MPEVHTDQTETRPLRLIAVGAAQGRLRYGAGLLASGEFATVAIVDTDQRTAKIWARELRSPDAELFGTIAALLGSEANGQIAAIALPVTLRTRVIRAFSQRGIPCLSEAPLGETLADTDAVLVAAQDAGVPIFPLLVRRFDPFVQEVSRLLQEESIGTLQHVRCEWTLPIGESTVHEISGTADPVSAWHAILQEATFHSADLCRVWLGDAFSVSADLDLNRNYKLPATTPTNRRTAETIATLIVNHDRGQATHHLARVHGAQAGERYVLTGTGGEIQFLARAGIRQSSLTAPALTLTRHGQRTEEIAIETYDLPVNALRTSLLLDYAADVLRGKTSETPLVGQDARAALEIVHAAYAASYDGVKVLLPLKQSPDIAAMLRDPNAPLGISA